MCPRFQVERQQAKEPRTSWRHEPARLGGRNHSEPEATGKPEAWSGWKTDFGPGNQRETSTATTNSNDLGRPVEQYYKDHRQHCDVTSPAVKKSGASFADSWRAGSKKFKFLEVARGEYTPNLFVVQDLDTIASQQCSAKANYAGYVRRRCRNSKPARSTEAWIYVVDLSADMLTDAASWSTSSVEPTPRVLQKLQAGLWEHNDGAGSEGAPVTEAASRNSAVEVRAERDPQDGGAERVSKPGFLQHSPERNSCFLPQVICLITVLINYFNKCRVIPSN